MKFVLAAFLHIHQKCRKHKRLPMGHSHIEWSSLFRNTNWTCHSKRLMCKHIGFASSSSSMLLPPSPLPPTPTSITVVNLVVLPEMKCDLWHQNKSRSRPAHLTVVARSRTQITSYARNWVTWWTPYCQLHRRESTATAKKLMRHIQQSALASTTKILCILDTKPVCDCAGRHRVQRKVT